jgi:hypothetical protein
VTEAGDSPHPSIGNDDEKIDTHDRETDGGEEECLPTRHTVNCEGERTLAPARNAAAVKPRKAGARRRRNQLPRHDEEAEPLGTLNLFRQVKFILQLKKSSETGKKYLGHKQENPVP